MSVLNEENPRFDDQCIRDFDLNQRLIFGRPVIHLYLTGKSL